MLTKQGANTSSKIGNNKFNQKLVTSIGLILFVVVVCSIFFGNYLSDTRIPKFNTIENAKLKLSFYQLDLQNETSSKLNLNSNKKTSTLKLIQDEFKNLLNTKSWDNYIYPTFTQPQIITINQILNQLKQDELIYKGQQNLKIVLEQHQADFNTLINKISDLQVSLYQRHFNLVKKFRFIQLILFLAFLLYIAVAFFLFKRYKQKSSSLILNQELVLEDLKRKNYFLKKSQFIANIGYYYYDFKTNLWTASEFILKLINYNEGKYPLNMWIDIIHPEDRTILTDVLKKRLYDPNVVLDVVYRIINPKNGNIHWMHHFAKAIEQDENGENLPIVGIVQDITIQKENDIRINRFNQIMESTLNEIYIVDYKNLSFIEVNEAVLFNLNYTKSELLNLTVSDIAPDMTSKNIESLRLKLTTQKTIIFETYQRRKDGSTYPVEAHIQKGKQGDTNVFFIIVLDISERDTSIQKLKDSENRWKFAIEGTRDGLWDLNYKTNKIYYSKQWKEMLGYQDHEIENTEASWEELVHPDDIARVKFTSHLHFDKKTPNYASEYRMLCKDGTYKWILDRGKVVERDESGKPIRVIGVHTDISERKALEKSLFQKSQLLAKHMNHTPLAAIYTDTDFIIKEWNKAAENNFAYTAEEALGKNLFDLIVPENQQKEFKLIYNDLILEKGGNISNIINQTKNGSLLNCIWYNTLIKEENDQPIGYASLVENVTKQMVLEETIKQIEKTISFKTGKDYYDSLAKVLNKTLKADYLLIGKNNDNQTITTISYLNQQEIVPNITYDLKNTPCELLSDTDYCYFDKNVTEQFNLDEDLKTLKIEAYMGVAIYDAKEYFIGNVVAMYCKPINEETHFKSLMRVVANKIGSEMERNKLIDALYSKQLDLQNAQEIAKLGSFNLDLTTYKASVSKIFIQITGLKETSQIDFHKDWRSIVFQEDQATNQKMLEHCIATGDKFDLEYRILTHDKKELKWIHGLGEIIYNQDKPVHFVGTIQDITKKHQLEHNFIQTILDVQEQEKQSFGEDLHDGLSQILTTESLYIDLLLKLNNNEDEKRVEFLSKIKELNISAIHDTRGIAHGLMSKQLQEKGLIKAIDQICNDYNNSKDIEFSFVHSDSLKEEEILKEIKIQLYRITQEISTNIVRHSDATKATISLNKVNSNKLELIVKDNGVGINMDKKRKENKGSGLLNIERRVKLLNGTATIDTAENKGTKYNVVVPLIDS